jgi:AraC-like DNA-binding protein
MAEPFAEYLRVHPNLHRAHGHSFYHIVFFTKGAGYHTIDFERYPVEPGQIYFMAPGQVHSWAFEGEVDGYVVNFGESLFHDFLADHNYLDRFLLLSGITGSNVMVLKGEAFEEATALLSRLVEEVHATAPNSLDLARTSLLRLFILADRLVPNADPLANSPRPNQILLHNFRKLLSQYYNQYNLPKYYAALLYVTPNHLNAVCQDLLGKSAGTLIRERILLEAKRQLVNADRSIAEIAYSLGFTDNSYFTKFFRKYTGTTPEEFKRAALQPPINT